MKKYGNPGQNPGIWEEKKKLASGLQSFFSMSSESHGRTSKVRKKMPLGL